MFGRNWSCLRCVLVSVGFAKLRHTWKCNMLIFKQLCTGSNILSCVEDGVMCSSFTHVKKFQALTHLCILNKKKKKTEIKHSQRNHLQPPPRPNTHTDTKYLHIYSTYIHIYLYTLYTYILNIYKSSVSFFLLFFYYLFTQYFSNYLYTLLHSTPVSFYILITAAGYCG